MHAYTHTNACTHGCVQAQLVADSNQTIYSSKVIGHGDPHWTWQTAAYTQACFITFKNNAYNTTDAVSYTHLTLPTMAVV